MSSITISSFTPITIPVESSTTLDDVDVSIGSSTRVIDLALSSTPFEKSLSYNKITVKPDSRWLTGSTISLSISGTPYPTVYRVPEDPYLYDPEQLLYSSDILGAATAEDLVSRGLGTAEELSLLTSMGPKLTACLDKFIDILYAKLTYDNIVTNPLVVRLVGFRRMQQLAYLLGLGALVESQLLSPGPLRSWFRQAYIAGANSDSSVLENLASLEKDIASVHNAMTLAELNTDVINSIDYQLATTSRYNKLARYIVTLFCAVRYTHDNTKFIY